MIVSDRALLLRDLTRDLLLAGRLWRKIGREAAAKHGVSEAASAPLIWIERLGENVRQNALADAIGIEGASLVRLIDELQASGLVTRVPDASDRRANVVSLTRLGRTVVAAVNEDLMALRREVFADLPASDIAAALRVFGAIKAAATKGEYEPS
jgi:MarR family transcriptional regulator for hemolysin